MHLEDQPPGKAGGGDRLPSAVEPSARPGGRSGRRGDSEQERRRADDADLAAIEGAMVAIRRSQRRRALARATEPAGGDLAMFDVLDAVEAAEEVGDEATVSSIAGALDVAQPRASKLVAAAVDAGLLTRVADQADGRRALLRRTEAGRELCARVHASRRGMFDAAMVGWSPRDRAAFARLLARFVAGVTQVTRERH